MKPRRPAPGIVRIALCLLTAASFGSSAAAQTPPAAEDAPVVAYWRLVGGGFEAVVADAAGNDLHVYRDFPKMSLNGGVLAGEVPGKRRGVARVVGFDAASGDRLFRIPAARLPVVLDGGRKVAFSPTVHRDDTTRSVWMRTPAGRLRKIAQFAQGSLPGIRHGMGGGALPLDMAFDERGRYMALVGGLETLRSFDVWIVDTKTKEATRMTRGENSHNPSLTPDGSRLAVRVERPEPCTDPVYGEILVGKIRVFSLTTGEGRTLTEWSCDLLYDTPRWIDDDTLVAGRAARDATMPFGWDLDIVEIDPETGAITDMVTEGNPCCA
ncbi:MAG: hypothetical protein M3279_01855, partial [Actinomycetota bacterium]|nr:hypothetical protein [Actinomycetota bacterium]